jgi:hypothetical protein
MTEPGVQLPGNRHQNGVQGNCENAGHDIHEGDLHTVGTEGGKHQPVTAEHIPNEKDAVAVAKKLGIAGNGASSIAENLQAAGAFSPDPLPGSNPPQNQQDAFEGKENGVFRLSFRDDTRFKQDKNRNEGDVNKVIQG